MSSSARIPNEDLDMQVSVCGELALSSPRNSPKTPSVDDRSEEAVRGEERPRDGSRILPVDHDLPDELGHRVAGESGAHRVEPPPYLGAQLLGPDHGVMFSASWRCLSSRSGMNPFASMLGSVENIKPICTSSLLSAATVSGPPASSGSKSSKGFRRRPEGPACRKGGADTRAVRRSTAGRRRR